MNPQTIRRTYSTQLSSSDIWSKNIEKLFKNLDKDKSGQIEVAEIKRYLRKCCCQTKEQSRQASKYLLTAFDKNGDRVISKEEFISHFDEMNPESAKKGIAHALKLYDDYRHRRVSSAEDVALFVSQLTHIHDKGKAKHVRNLWCVEWRWRRW